MTHYLIEFRFSGKAKGILKDLIYTISKTYHVKGATRKKVVPHISLAGPLYTKDQKKLVKEFQNIIKKYDCVSFKLDGFDKFERENKVIFVKIKPSKELLKLRNEIVKKLKKFCDMNEHDYEKDYSPHATIAFKDIDRKFNQIWNYLESWEIPKMNQFVLRVTLIKNSKILYEYDLMLKKLLRRSEALNRSLFQKTLEKYFEKRKKLGLENWTILETDDVTDKGKIFLISDTHFDHKNIIRYCNRPFTSKNKMNEALLNNWNFTVGKSDIVFFLGDLAYGHGKRSIDYWLSKLNGKKFFIRGNHDKDIITKAKVIPDRYTISYKNQKFMLMHDPHRPFGWDGWIIHGDKHNNNLEDFPGIHKKNKTINICSEMIQYTPISLEEIISKIK